MAKVIPPCKLLEDDDGEEEYIDMDISSAVDMDVSSTTSTFLPGTMLSPPHAKEFEFGMGANPTGAEAATCPADELFYEGKLLALHHVLAGKKPMLTSGVLEEKFAAAPSTAVSTATTPFESCNISPASSCFVSGELSADDYILECSFPQNRSIHKKSWSKKLKSIKQSSVALKLKASRDYLKSLFTKYSCPDEPRTAKKNANEAANGYMKAVNSSPLSQIQMKRYLFGDSFSRTSLMKVIERENMMEEESLHRKSFGAINWNLVIKPSSCSSSVSSSSSSSSSSANSNGFHQPQMLKRSNSANSEVECSIQGAIAYCKKSQQLNCGRKSVSDVGFYSIAATCMDKEG